MPDFTAKSQVLSLRLDEGVKDTLASLVDDDYSGDVLGSCRCRVRLTREAQDFIISVK